jgi:hypothetical protein
MALLTLLKPIPCGGYCTAIILLSRGVINPGIWYIFSPPEPSLHVPGVRNYLFKDRSNKKISPLMQENRISRGEELRRHYTQHWYTSVPKNREYEVGSTFHNVMGVGFWGTSWHRSVNGHAARAR